MSQCCCWKWRTTRFLFSMFFLWWKLLCGRKQQQYYSPHPIRWFEHEWTFGWWGCAYCETKFTSWLCIVDGATMGWCGGGIMMVVASPGRYFSLPTFMQLTWDVCCSHTYTHTHGYSIPPIFYDSTHSLKSMNRGSLSDHFFFWTGLCGNGDN